MQKEYGVEKEREIREDKELKNIKDREYREKILEWFDYVLEKKKTLKMQNTV